MSIINPNLLDRIQKHSTKIDTEFKKFDKPNITRLEIIDGNGRVYVNMDVKDIEFSLQDENRTLKIFIK
jgi:hypothetical protein